MDRNILRAYLLRPSSRREIIHEFCMDKHVLDLGCVCHDMANVSSTGWLHRMIFDVAKDVLGIDYLEDEVEMLRKRGFKVVRGDVTKPLPVDRTFEVIVVGNLIEHLSNFEGLMDNLRRLLAPGGVVLIGTANPFFREQYFYTALKNDIIVNPEHTCWIDPVTLDQLSRRFGFATTEVRWIKEKWRLSQTIFNGESQSLDIFTGHWVYRMPPGRFERMAMPLLKWVSGLALNPVRKLQAERRYGPNMGRFLYMRVKGVFVEVWWALRRIVIPTGHVNKHELYISVLKCIS